MKRRVVIEWREEVSYRSVVEVDLPDPATKNDGRVLGAMWEIDEAEWFEQCDTTKDFMSVDEREIVTAKLEGV